MLRTLAASAEPYTASAPCASRPSSSTRRLSVFALDSASFKRLSRSLTRWLTRWRLASGESDPTYASSTSRMLSLSLAAAASAASASAGLRDGLFVEPLQRVELLEEEIDVSGLDEPPDRRLRRGALVEVEDLPQSVRGWRGRGRQRAGGGAESREVEELSRPRRGHRGYRRRRYRRRSHLRSVRDRRGGQGDGRQHSHERAPRRVGILGPAVVVVLLPAPGAPFPGAGGATTSLLLFISDVPKFARGYRFGRVTGSADRASRLSWLSRARGFRSRGRAMETKAIGARVSAIGPRVLAVDAIPRRRRRLGLRGRFSTRGGKWLRHGCEISRGFSSVSRFGCGIIDAGTRPMVAILS